MGDFDVLTITLALAGTVILYGAIKNRNPIDVIKLTLQGKPLDSATPLFTASGMTSSSQNTPGSVDSLGVSGFVDGILKNLGVDGSLVIIPYQGHPTGSHAGDCDVPGFLGGVAGQNHSFAPSDAQFHCSGPKGGATITKSAYLTPFAGGTGSGGAFT